MTEGIKQHLPVIVAVTLVGMASTYFILSRIAAGAASMTVDVFNGCMFWIPCVVMLLGTAVIAMTAEEISRQLYVVCVGICLATGLLCVLGTSFWLADATIASQLLANSGDGAAIVPITDSPLLMVRDLAAFVVVPTVGSVLGAWIGSRLHPMRAAKKGRRR